MRLKQLKPHGFNRNECYARLYIKQQGRCADCHGFFARLSIDHIVPTAMGGADTPANWQLLCRRCNSRKSDKVTPGIQHTIFDSPQEHRIRVDRGQGTVRVIATEVYVAGRPSRANERTKKANRREKARAQGLCIVCATRPAREGRATCQECSDAAAARTTARRKAKNAG